MTDEQEVWKAIPEFDDYEASSFGRVRRIKAGPGSRVGHVLSQKMNRNGYWRINLQRNLAPASVYVHQLVAATFHGGWPQDNMAVTVAHWDGGKTNNRADNLRWASRSDNEADKRRHGTFSSRGCKPKFKVTMDQAATIKRAVEGGESIRSVSRSNRVPRDLVRAIIYGRNEGRYIESAAA